MSGSQLLGQYLAKIVQPGTLAVFFFFFLGGFGSYSKDEGLRDDDWTTPLISVIEVPM